MKTLSIVNPCFNEEGNVRELYERVRAVMNRLGHYRYEHIFIDNSSKDGTVAILRELAARDKNVKIIVNTRNFGHIRSPFHALQQARGARDVREEHRRARVLTSRREREPRRERRRRASPGQLEEPTPRGPWFTAAHAAVPTEWQWCRPRPGRAGACRARRTRDPGV